MFLFLKNFDLVLLMLCCLSVSPRCWTASLSKNYSGLSSSPARRAFLLTEYSQSSAPCVERGSHWWHWATQSWRTISEAFPLWCVYSTAWVRWVLSTYSAWLLFTPFLQQRSNVYVVCVIFFIAEMLCCSVSGDGTHCWACCQAEELEEIWSLPICQLHDEIQTFQLQHAQW